MTAAVVAGGITVHRCVVRVVRRGGWSWGPDPRGLVRQALDALPDLLPDLLAERFAAELAGDGPDVEVTEPVTLTVRLRRPAGAMSSRPTGLVVEPAGSPAVDRPAPEQSTVDSEAAVAAPRPDRRTPAVLFAELAGRGELAPLLASLPDDSLRVYLLAVLEDLVWSVPPNGDAVLTALAAEFARRHAATPPASPRPPSGADLLALVRALPTPRDTPDTPDSPAAPAPTTGAPTPVPDPVPVGETRVCSVLPFLLAGPLARIGYLDAIGPALAAVDLLADAPLFAAALAYKVLAAPERGWRHTGDTHAAAAAFAGLTEVGDLGGFAARVAPALPVLDGVLALSLCRGHDPADPLLVAGVDGGLLLVDSVGLFPVAWAPEVAGLLGHWAACGRPDLVVCDGPLPPHCLRELAAAGAGLVTAVRPLRDDPLTRLPRPAPLWTAGHPAPGLAADLPAHTANLDELLRELATRRVAHRAAGGALDRSALLAASLGLGLVSWTLWRERETPTPVLALSRFADLEATVRYTPDAVRVRIPLGRRHADLLRHGALTDVGDVVWLGGRTLTFAGG